MIMIIMIIITIMIIIIIIMIMIIMQGNPADELARHGEIVESLQSFSQVYK